MNKANNLSWTNPDEGKTRREVRLSETKREKLWSRPDDVTGELRDRLFFETLTCVSCGSIGLSIHKSRTPSGHELQVRMLGQPPTKAHVEKVLPNKIKRWIGM